MRRIFLNAFVFLSQNNLGTCLLFSAVAIFGTISAKAIPEKAGVAAPDQVADGVSAWHSGDYKKAAIIFLPLAKHGNSTAQVDLGVLYVLGRGVPQDFNEAAKWFLMSAMQGNIDGAYNLGDSYYRGRGVAQDFDKAARWLLAAAKQNEKPAQFDLGLMAVRGQGMPASLPRAYMWFSLSADDGAKGAIANRDKARSRMSEQQVSEALKMVKHCKATDYKDCN